MAVSLGDLQLPSPSCPGKIRLCAKCKRKINWVFTTAYFTFLLPRRRGLERDGISTFLGGQPGGAWGLIDRFSPGKVSVTEAGTCQMWPRRPCCCPQGRRLWSLCQSTSFQMATRPIILRLSNPNLLWLHARPQQTFMGEPLSCFTFCNNMGQSLATEPSKGNAPSLSSCPLSIRTSPALCTP